MIRTNTLLNTLVNDYFLWKGKNPDRCWHIRDLAYTLGLSEKLQEKLTERALKLNSTGKHKCHI